MDSIILLAAQTAKRWHQGQLRKYHKRPYIEHPARVAGRVSMIDGVTADEVAAAWMHDVVEDTPCTYGDLLSDGFSEKTVTIIRELTNPSKEHAELPRIERKKMDLAHLAKVSHEAQRIKLIDRTDNLRDLSLADRGFQSLYAAESVHLAAVLKQVDDELLEELFVAIESLGYSRDHADDRA